MLDASAVVRDVVDIPYVQCCKWCYSALYVHNMLPKFALANDMFVGCVLDALKGLSIVEECMIARRRAKVFIIHLN